MSEPYSARMSGPAFRFALLLRDFGHLDEAGLSQLLITASEHIEDPESDDPEISLRAIRRAAALQLFERDAGDLHTARGILFEDWPLLFS